MPCSDDRIRKFHRILEERTPLVLTILRVLHYKNYSGTISTFSSPITSFFRIYGAIFQPFTHLASPSLRLIPSTTSSHSSRIFDSGIAHSVFFRRRSFRACFHKNEASATVIFSHGSFPRAVCACRSQVSPPSFSLIFPPFSFPFVSLHFSLFSLFFPSFFFLIPFFF